MVGGLNTINAVRQCFFTAYMMGRLLRSVNQLRKFIEKFNSGDDNVVVSKTLTSFVHTIGPGLGLLSRKGYQLTWDMARKKSSSPHCDRGMNISFLMDTLLSCW